MQLGPPASAQPAAAGRKGVQVALPQGYRLKQGVVIAVTGSLARRHDQMIGLMPLTSLAARLDKRVHSSNVWNSLSLLTLSLTMPACIGGNS